MLFKFKDKLECFYANKTTTTAIIVIIIIIKINESSQPQRGSDSSVTWL